LTPQLWVLAAIYRAGRLNLRYTLDTSIHPRYAVPPHSYDKLELHKSDCGDTGHALDWCHCARLRERLLTEIHALEERLSALQNCEAEIDHSMRQTCREMIHSRQQLFLQLRR
jgi:hypothetical protein